MGLRCKLWGHKPDVETKAPIRVDARGNGVPVPAVVWCRRCGVVISKGLAMLRRVR